MKAVKNNHPTKSETKKQIFCNITHSTVDGYRRIMKKLLIFPTWVLVRLLIPVLPKTHVWYGQKITLDSWAKNATQMNYGFAIIFWFQPIYIFILLKIFLKH